MAKRKAASATTQKPSEAEVPLRADGMPNTAAMRRGTHTIDELEAGVKDLKNLTAALDALVVSAKEIGVEALHIDGTTKLARAQDLIHDFMRGVDVALTKERYKRRVLLRRQTSQGAE